MKQYLILLLCLFLPLIVKSQSIFLNDNFSMEVKKVKLKKTATGGKGWIVNEKGIKYLTLRYRFYSKTDKRSKFEVYKMIVRVADKEYMAFSNAVAVPVDTKDRYFRMGKKTNRFIYFDVPESFSQGQLYYDGKLIGIINGPSDSKKGLFKMIAK